MNILLVGATGQIGTALARALSQTSHRVTALVRNKPRLAFPGEVNLLEAGAFSPQAFDRALRGVDCAIYGAGLPEQFLPDPESFQRVNVDLFKTFLDALVRSPVRRLAYISTYEVFQPVDGVIRETHPVADPQGWTPYFKAMIQAYRLATAFEAKTGITLTTIHPAAVYGGLNTGDGFTNYIENLIHRRFWKTPAIIPGRFPVVHVDSLAKTILLSLHRAGAYLVSDQMTSLREIALTLHQYTRSYVPPTIPVWMAGAGAALLEEIAGITRRRPVMSRIQIEFITRGLEPETGRAQAELGWAPLSLDQGIQQYLQDRSFWLGQAET